MCAFLQKKNNARTTLAEAIIAEETAWDVTDASKLPASPDFMLTCWDESTYLDPGNDPNMEVVRVTGIAGNTLTVTKAQESTGDNAHSSGDTVALLITAGTLDEHLNQDVKTTDSPQFAGLTVDTTTLVVNASGYEDKVGIGTATPAVALDVKGNARIGTASYYLAITHDGDNVLLQNNRYQFGLKTGTAMTFDSDARYLFRQAGNTVFTITVDDTNDQTILTSSATTGGNQIIIAQQAYYSGKDFDHVAQTNPTLFVHSATDPDTANTQWISLAHNQTNGVIDVGLGSILMNDDVLMLAGTASKKISFPVSAGPQVDLYNDYSTGNAIFHMYLASTGDLLQINNSGGLTLGYGKAGYDIPLVFDGETNDGTITYYEDENAFVTTSLFQAGDYYSGDGTKGGTGTFQTSDATAGYTWNWTIKDGLVTQVTFDDGGGPVNLLS